MLCPECKEFVAPNFKYCPQCGIPVFHSEETFINARKVTPTTETKTTQQTMHKKKETIDYLVSFSIVFLIGSVIFLIIVLTAIISYKQGYRLTLFSSSKESTAQQPAQKQESKQPTQQPTQTTEQTTAPAAPGQSQQQEPQRQDPPRQQPTPEQETLRLYEIGHYGYAEFPAIDPNGRLIPTSFYVNPGEFKAFNFSLYKTIKVHCYFIAKGGAGNDIQVFIANAQSMVNLQNGHSAPVFYDSRQLTTDSFYIILPAGEYSIGFNNKFSIFTRKFVNAELFYYTQGGL